MAAVGAYPRVCGATRMTSFGTGPVAGLSPRVRGNPYRLIWRSRLTGPIPACAGQPGTTPSCPGSPGAYPRVCGATRPRQLKPSRQRGLSPRVRGNPSTRDSIWKPSGPIPACAGQPAYAADGEGDSGAYPRVCGATMAFSLALLSAGGLSPRVRGNRKTFGSLVQHGGPIPACAGQPSPPSSSLTKPGAYPRVCGATGTRSDYLKVKAGLSPRVRGNPFGGSCGEGTPGPIPACAGQPDLVQLGTAVIRAYPRVCGATEPSQPVTAGPWGLSPRVRGNPLLSGFSELLWGPIPACAGQPPQFRQSHRLSRAYPRVCGATTEYGSTMRGVMGLSPRVRGNLLLVSEQAVDSGPIPACAGQPGGCPGRFIVAGAYPRVCGATSCT